MPTSYTSLLGLALPVTGELSGTWGDTVNDYITQYLDASVAGTQTISGSQTAVTLSKTTATSLSQAGSGATGSSQYNIINCTGNPASMLTVTVPAASKTYVVVNATSTNQDVKIVGAGPTTGVTLVAGEKAVIAWNGSDFIKIATSTADGVTTLSFGSTGLTPSTATSGAVTVAGTLVAANGGTGQSSYTTGDLLYATGSTALSKLGIGTNGQILTSTGTAPQWSTLSGVAVTTFSAGTTGFTPSSATSGAVTLAGTLATTNGGTGLTSFTANGVVYASSTSALTTGSALTFDGTNFAVGTTTINNANTDVVTVGKNSGTYDASIVVRQFGTGTAAGLQLIAAGDTGAAYNSITSTTSGGTQHWKLGGVAGSAGTLPFSVSGTEAMRLTSTGLGIGTSSPAAKLTVLDTTANAATALVRLLGQNSYNLDIQSVTNGAGTVGNRYNFAIGSGGGEFSFSNSGGTRLTLDSSGNLGLGMAPSAWNTAFAPVLQIKTPGGGAGAFAGSGVDNFRMFANTYYDGSYKRIGAGYATQYEQASGYHAWYTAGSSTANSAISFSQAMYLDASGNLGIGTSSPAEKLSVAGNITNTGVATFGTSGSNTYVSLNNNGYLRCDVANWFTLQAGSNGYQWRNSANSSTAQMTLDSSGNLGLGVTPSAWTSGYTVAQFGPQGSLSSYSDGSIRLGSNWRDSSGIKYLANGFATLYRQETGTHSWFTAPSGTAGNAISFTTAMTLDASGNLMVGATSSSAIANKNIDVNGTGDSALVLRVGGTTTAYLYSIASQAILGTVGALPITFNPNGTERARITSGGNVSIGGSADRGTTVGSAALQLFNGTAPAGTLTNGVSLYSSSGDLNFMNSAGNGFKVGYRNLPPVGTQTGSYTLATGDVGKYVQVGSGGSITIPDATFAEGDAVSIFNNTTGNITITCSITTAYIAGTDSDKATMTLATRGVATILFISGTVCVVSGNVT